MRVAMVHARRWIIVLAATLLCSLYIAAIVRLTNKHLCDAVSVVIVNDTGQAVTEVAIWYDVWHDGRVVWKGRLPPHGRKGVTVSIFSEGLISAEATLQDGTHLPRKIGDYVGGVGNHPIIFPIKSDHIETSSADASLGSMTVKMGGDWGTFFGLVDAGLQFLSCPVRVLTSEIY